MGSDLQLVLMIAALHLMGLVLAGLLIMQCLRSDTVRPWSPPDGGDDSGGGGGSARPRPPRSPSGPHDGDLPLPESRPARVRLREPDRLGDLVPPHERRPSHPSPPSRPERVPQRAAR